MDYDNIVIILGTLSVPAALLGALMLTGWGYRRSLALSMARTAGGHRFVIETDAPTIFIAKSPLVFRCVDPAAVSATSRSIEQAAAAARHLTCKFRAAH